MDSKTQAKMPPRSATYTVAGHRIEFRKPTREQWDDHQKKVRSDKHSKSPAMRELCQHALTSSLEEFQAAIKVKPAFPAVACRELGVLAGRRIDAVANPDGVSATLDLADGRTWLFNSPEFDTWEDCQEQLATGKSERELIFRELAIRCLADQGQKASLESFFEEFPAAHEGLSNVLTALAGGDIEAEVKKE